MKLRNKKTGEIVVFVGTYIKDGRVFFRLQDEKGIFKKEINSLAELCEEWEDYEEPKKFWCIIDNGNIAVSNDTDEDVEASKEIGNYFETKEEAEKVVEKLKAWKRLEGAGFKFKEWKHTPLMETVDGYKIHIEAYTDKMVAVMKDLDLLFGGNQ